MHYRFKIYFNDGTVELSGGRGKTPTCLYNDFDGLMDWDEFDNLSKKNMTTKKELELAFKVYKNLYKKEYYRIEIINDETNEIIDYIEEGHWHYLYKNLDDYENDEPLKFRDENSAESKDKEWNENGYSMSVEDLKYLKEELLNKKYDTSVKLLLK